MTVPLTAQIEVIIRAMLELKADAAALERAASEEAHSGPLLLTISQVAEELQCSRGTVSNLITRGETLGGLPSVRLGEKGDAVRVPRDALLRWIARQAK